MTVNAVPENAASKVSALTLAVVVIRMKIVAADHAVWQVFVTPLALIARWMATAPQASAAITGFAQNLAAVAVPMPIAAIRINAVMTACAVSNAAIAVLAITIAVQEHAVMQAFVSQAVRAAALVLRMVNAAKAFAATMANALFPAAVL
jgi:hypothetical protein